MATVRLLICDLDNTLYDWVGYFVPSFYAMVDEVINITKWDREILLDDFKKVHQKHHDTEHPFALLETHLVQQNFSDKNIRVAKDHFDSAFHAFNSVRKNTLKVFPQVYETLNTLKRNDVCLVAHTDAKFYAAVDRLRRLSLIEYFDRVFCRERADSRHPDGLSNEDWLKGVPTEKILELSHHQRKPDPSVLLEICSTMKCDPSRVAYIGDSIAHDIKMANDANVLSIFAEYGTKRDQEDWEKLVRVTHWTEEDVIREARLREEAKSTEADFVAMHSFSEIKVPLELSN